MGRLSGVSPGSPVHPGIEFHVVVFSSYTFLFLFLPLVLVLYYVLPLLAPKRWADTVRDWRGLVLLVSSYIFYGWARYWYVLLILASTLVDLVCGRLIADAGTRRKKRALLMVSLATNLGMLGYFKYRDFAVDAFIQALGVLGMGVSAPGWPRLVLPVGISFYTFQSMSYTIDVYRGVVSPLPWKRSLHFISYVALFPQLVAGPIVRFRDIAAELVDRRHSWGLFGQGTFFFMVGMAKKVLIANRVGPMADALFGLDAPGALDSWAGMVSYALQIYFDFSGYSDMAIGLGMMFGFHFPWNFNAPYKALSITDFWRRWHISLSTWLRDYLYIPLGGNRSGTWKTYRNLMITMLLGGLWHGAAWTFVLWGAFHGGLLALERRFGKRPVYHRCPAAARVGLTFALVLFAWVLFRAPDLAHAGRVYAGLLGAHGWGGFTLRGPFSWRVPVGVLACGALLVWFAPTTQQMAARGGWSRVVLVLFLFAVAVVELLQSAFNPFLYYQF